MDLRTTAEFGSAPGAMPETTSCRRTSNRGRDYSRGPVHGQDRNNHYGDLLKRPHAYWAKSAAIARVKLIIAPLAAE